MAERLGDVATSARRAGGLAPITTPLGEMFMFTIEGAACRWSRTAPCSTGSAAAAARLPGVADINALGGHVKSYEVVPDSPALAARGLSPAPMLARRWSRTTATTAPAGCRNGEEALVVRAEGSIRTLDDMRRSSIAVRGGVPVRVADVAAIRVGSLTRYGVVTATAGEAVEGLVLGPARRQCARGGGRRARRSWPRSRRTCPPARPSDVFYDRGAWSTGGQDGGKALAEAIVLVVVLLILFLGNLRAALVVAPSCRCRRWPPSC